MWYDNGMGGGTGSPKSARDRNNQSSQAKSGQPKGGEGADRSEHECEYQDPHNIRVTPPPYSRRPPRRPASLPSSALVGDTAGVVSYGCKQ